jgi:hypothetical protein
MTNRPTPDRLRNFVMSLMVDPAGPVAENADKSALFRVKRYTCGTWLTVETIITALNYQNKLL